MNAPCLSSKLRVPGRFSRSQNPLTLFIMWLTVIFLMTPMIWVWFEHGCAWFICWKLDPQCGDVEKWWNLSETEPTQ